MRTPSVNQQVNLRAPAYPQSGSATDGQAQPARATPSITPQPPYNNNTAQFNRQQSFPNTTPYHASTPSLPQQQIGQQNYQWNQPQTQTTPLVAAHPTSYNAATPAYSRNMPPNVQPVPYNVQPVNPAVQHRIAEAYVLSDAANMTIPKHVRDQFPTDDQGRVLFFTSPPLNTQHIVSGSSANEEGRPLAHTEQYMRVLAFRKRKHDEILDGTDGNQPERKAEANAARSSNAVESSPATLAGIETTAKANASEAITKLVDQIRNSTDAEYKAIYGDEWRQIFMADLQWADQRKKQQLGQDRAAETKREVLRNAHLGRHNGQFALNTQGYITDWQKSFFTGTYLDDHDSRLPF